VVAGKQGLITELRDFQEYLMRGIKTTGKQLNIKEILEEKLEKAKFKVGEVVYYKSHHDPSTIYKYKVISIDVIVEYYYATDSYGEENSLELCYEAGAIKSHTDITSLIGYDRITEILNSKLSYKLGDITTGEFSCWQSENELYNSLEDYVSNIKVIDGE
jgi:hypothetical protein